MAGYAMNESNYINSLNGITEIKSLNWHKSFIERNNVIFSDFQSRAFNLGKIKISLGLLTNLAGTLYLVAVLVYSSIEVMQSGMTPGELMAILTLSSSLLPSVLNLALLPIPFNEAKVAITRMFEFTKMDPEEQITDSGDTNMNIDKISLKNISFRFPGQKLLLKDINIAIEKGSIVALIGESGCGKSTLANIVLRFYDPETGSMLINEKAGTDCASLQSWRSSVGIIPQDIHIFNGTIISNILSDANEDNLERLSGLISENGLESFFNAFPSGLTTLVGEEGVKLSGGQKQVIAFLRVLVQQPEILVIDEGTSSMDRDSELTIIKLLFKIKKETGILLITHRINLIKQICDYIYVLENGVITSYGTHNELVCSDNLYKKYWKDFA